MSSIFSTSTGLSLLAGGAAAISCGVLWSRWRRHSARLTAAEAALVERERRVQLALEGSNDGLWHWNRLTDTTHFSARVTEMLNYDTTEMASTIGAFLDIVHPDDRQAAKQSFEAHLEHQTPYDAEFRLRLKSGEYRWFRARGDAERDLSQRATRTAGSFTDVTDRKLAEAVISRHAMQQELIAELGQMALKNPSTAELWNHAIIVITRGLPADFCRLLCADPDGKSLNLIAASGWDEDWSQRRSYDAVEETEDRFIVGVREAVIIDDFESNTRYKPSAMLRAHSVRSGAEMLICGSQDAHGVLGIYSREPEKFALDNLNFLRGIANILASSMDRSLTDERLTYLAQFDSLTGLPNRSMFLDRLWHTIAEAEIERSHTAVVFIDLDGFKLVNDTLGHGAGDQLLLQVAQRLLQHSRPTDNVGRMGGDEFTVALPHLAYPATAGAIVLKILAALSAPFDLSGQHVYISASAGISVYPKDGTEPDTLMKNADTAMYKAKQSGKNMLLYYEPEMQESATRRLSMETELRGALERREFKVHYQPKVSIRTGEISGFEALLRWQHPDRGLVPPTEFISILEDTGLIVPVGEWVLATVCQQLNEWQADGLPLHPIAVNLSARQFAQADLQTVIPRVLGAAGIAPGMIELELTESLLMVDSEAATKILNGFQKLGIRISVDDFGTGYSSLAYLKRFPLDSLKIDRAFIRDVTTDADGATIVLAIINLAHSLKLKVIAEGVETEAQFAFLRKHDCDEMQGYYFAKPQPAEDCARALRDGWQLVHSRDNAVHWLVRQA